MKIKIIILFIISLLFQSCTTFIAVNENDANLQKGKVYKIIQNKKKYKGKLINYDNQILTLKSYGKEIIVERNNIEIIKVRKFSIAKTIVVTPVVILGVSVISFIADPDINLGK